MEEKQKIVYKAEKKNENKVQSLKESLKQNNTQNKSQQELREFFENNKEFQLFQSNKMFQQFIMDLKNKNDQQLQESAKLLKITYQSILILKNLEKEEFQENKKILYKYLSNLKQSYQHEENLNILSNEINQQLNGLNPQQLQLDFTPKLNWMDQFPKQLIPEFTSFSLYNHLKLKEWKRAAYKIDHLRRKRRQVEFYIKLVQQKMEERQQQNNPVKHIVDFAGGRGDLAFVLAYLFPNVKVTLIDLKTMTIKQAALKKKMLKLENIQVIEGDIFDFQEPFDFAVGLHACGGLIDIIIKKCMEQQKFPSMIICTCCFGKIQAFQELFTYPKSKSAQESIGYQKDGKNEKYYQICNFAECDTLKKQPFNHEKSFQNKIYLDNKILQQIQVDKQQFDKFYEVKNKLAQQCKFFINYDRIKHIQQYYENVKPQLIQLPSDITPKNQMIIV